MHTITLFPSTNGSTDLLCVDHKKSSREGAFFINRFVCGSMTDHQFFHSFTAAHIVHAGRPIEGGEIVE